MMKIPAILKAFRSPARGVSFFQSTFIGIIAGNDVATLRVCREVSGITSLENRHFSP
jgi:hypothetical protein